MSERYNQHTADDVVQMMRGILRRLEALESPSAVTESSGLGTVGRAVPTSEITTPPVLTTSATLVPLFRVFLRKRSNTLQVLMHVACDAGTSGTIQLTVTSPVSVNVPGGSASLTTGQTGIVTITGDMTGIGTVGVTDLQIDVYAKRDLGSGNVRMLVAQAYG